MTDYIIIIEKGEGNRSAYCPDLPGVAAAAETEEETAELLVHSYHPALRSR